MENPAVVEISDIPLGYEVNSLSGAQALENPELISELSNVWAESYKQSTEPAQSNDSKYTTEGDQVRLDQIRDELSRPSAELVYISHKNNDGKEEIVGFFFGASVADLRDYDPNKADQVQKHTASDPEKTAYLSMMGVLNEKDGVKHTGKGLGQILTNEICARFKEKGFTEVVARTINPLALERVYKPLGFNVKDSFFDEKSETTRYIFSKLI